MAQADIHEISVPKAQWILPQLGTYHREIRASLWETQYATLWRHFFYVNDRTDLPRRSRGSKVHPNLMGAFDIREVMSNNSASEVKFLVSTSSLSLSPPNWCGWIGPASKLTHCLYGMIEQLLVIKGSQNVSAANR